MLVKRGDRYLKGWTERQVVLSEGEMAYFENSVNLANEVVRREAQPRGVLKFGEGWVVERMDGEERPRVRGAGLDWSGAKKGAGMPFCLRLADTAGDEFLFQASSDKERTSWLHAIAAHVRYATARDRAGGAWGDHAHGGRGGGVGRASGTVTPSGSSAVSSTGEPIGGGIEGAVLTSELTLRLKAASRETARREKHARVRALNRGLAVDAGGPQPATEGGGAGREPQGGAGGAAGRVVLAAARLGPTSAFNGPPARQPAPSPPGALQRPARGGAAARARWGPGRVDGRLVRGAARASGSEP